MNKFFSVLCFVLLFGFNALHSQNYSTHQVKKGETIEEIAKRYYVTTSDIYSLNPDARESFWNSAL